MPRSSKPGGLVSKVEYLGIEWTQVRLNPACMRIRKKHNGYEPYVDYTVPDEMWSWLNRETGSRQSSYITESQWWWDKDPKTDPRDILFHFRDPVIALKFKLTWGTV